MDNFEKRYEALLADDVDRYFSLLEPDFELNRVGRMGGTPLINAIAARAEAISIELIEKGADPNIGSYIDHERGVVSAYDLAVQRGLPVLSSLLHAKGAKTGAELFGAATVAGFRKGMLEARREAASTSKSPQGSGCLPILVMGFGIVATASYWLAGFAE